MTYKRKYCILVWLTLIGLVPLFLFSAYYKDTLWHHDYSAPESFGGNESSILSTIQEFITTDNISEDGLYHAHTNTLWPYFSNITGIRINDWTFTKRVQCPNLTFLPAKPSRQKASIFCQGGRPKLFHSMTDSSRDIQIFDSGDKCLEKFIQNRCYDNKSVPNLMHYIWIADVEVSFFTFVSFISVIRFMKPCLIMFHGPFVPRGQYWDFFIGLFPNVLLVNESTVTTIYGHKLKYIEHRADVMRINALFNYGGLYMDWDAALVKPIESLREKDCSMSLENIPQNLGNQVIISKKGSKFLELWLEGYRNYTDDWNFNSIKYPYILSKKYPGLISVQGYKLLVSNPMSRPYLWHKYSNWSNNYSLHFFLRGYHKRREVTLDSIRTMRTTIAAVIRHVLFGCKEQCLK